MIENSLWLFIVAGGPVVIALAYLFVMARRRRLTAREKAAQRRAVEELQHDERQDA